LGAGNRDQFDDLSDESLSWQVQQVEQVPQTILDSIFAGEYDRSGDPESCG
jgi:hypothetical protein